MFSFVFLHAMEGPGDDTPENLQNFFGDGDTVHVHNITNQGQDFYCKCGQKCGFDHNRDTCDARVAASFVAAMNADVHSDSLYHIPADKMNK